MNPYFICYKAALSTFGATPIPYPSPNTVLIFLIAYLIGSISTAVVVARVFNLKDPRSAGSNNAGATNVLRLGGWRAGLLTLIGDVAKGAFLPLLCVLYDRPLHAVMAAGVGAVLGHVYPIYFGLKGGKGVATGIGVLAVWHWPTCLIMLGTWLGTALLTRYASLASMLGFLMAAIYACLFTPLWAEPVLALSALILYKHQPNLKNLRAGTEPRLG
ncbi:Predicted membrane protein [gamma proteobacterium HdN1]|nr:Predicted membrane protein [gamma proteobacterium HdN1]